MDVSRLLAPKPNPFVVEKETPLDVDPGLLTVTDPNPIDVASYTADVEQYLLSTARDGVQTLFAALHALPSTPSPDGPLVDLPPPKTALPRAKPLPKPKPPTKWERFAAARGIQHRRRHRTVWDEERQEFVNRWGRDGKNKQAEEQWIHEVKRDAAVDFDPVQEARTARKARVAKNERQRLQNVARAQTAQTDRDRRSRDIDRTLASTRVSTASMGRFDKPLEGDKKMRGVKRKFEPTETSAEQEKRQALSLLSKLDGDTARTRKAQGGDDVLNVRKAIRAVSKGKGGVALGRETTTSKRGGKRGGKR